MGRVTKCSANGGRLLFVIENLVLLLCGATLLSLSAWMYAQGFLTTTASACIIGMIVLGGVLFLTCAVGIILTVRAQQHVVTVYWLVILLLFASILTVSTILLVTAAGLDTNTSSYLDSLGAAYYSKLNAAPDALCTYFRDNACSGFDNPCPPPFASGQCPTLCPYGTMPLDGYSDPQSTFPCQRILKDFIVYQCRVVGAFGVTTAAFAFFALCSVTCVLFNRMQRGRTWHDAMLM